MHLIGIIGFVAFGVLAIACAIAHELTWWRRRKWHRGHGVIVGFEKQEDANGVHYWPEIEFEGSDGMVRFVSQHGSIDEPKLGVSVEILIEASGKSAEHITIGRTLFTIIPMGFGLLFIVVGINIKPPKPAEPNEEVKTVQIHALP